MEKPNIVVKICETYLYITMHQVDVTTTFDETELSQFQWLSWTLSQANLTHPVATFLGMVYKGG